jgi:hypothetical protein
MTDQRPVVGPETTSADRHLQGMPAFVVIGAQKSASTFLQDQMSLHPQVEIAEGEVRHFEDPFYSAGAVSDLPSLFSTPEGSAVRGIKRPDYLGRPEIPGRLHEHLPEAKLLVVLRDPVARAVSSYYHFVRHGFVPLRPIDEAVRALLAGEWADSHPRSTEVLSFGMYGEHLTRYLEHYSAERIMVFDQAPLTKEPQAALRRAFEFIGVDPDFAIAESTNKVSNKGVYSPARLHLLRTKNRTRFTYTAARDRRFPKRMTPWGWLYNAAVVGLDRMVLSRFDDGRPPELSPQSAAALADYYAQDLSKLADLLPLWSVQASWVPAR